METDRLDRENAWRAAHDMKPVKSLEEIKDDAGRRNPARTRRRRSPRISYVTTQRRSAPTQARRTDKPAHDE